jgi:TonB family protein
VGDVVLSAFGRPIVTMTNSSQGIAEILKRLGARRSGGNVNLLEFSSGPGASSGGSSRGLLMLIVLTHAAMLGYLLGASLLFNADDRSGGSRTAHRPEPRQVSLNKVDRERMRATTAPAPLPQLVAAQYSQPPVIPASRPAVATTIPTVQVASSIWPEDKAVRTQEPATPPAAEPEHRGPPAEPTAPTPADAAPPLHFPPYPVKRPTVELAANAALDPHPPERRLMPPAAAQSSPETQPQTAPTAPAPTLAAAPEPAEKAAMRAVRWPEDSGHTARHARLDIQAADPASVAHAPPSAPEPPATIEIVVPAPPQPAPSAAERLAAQQMPAPAGPMTHYTERIGDPGIIIERFVAHEEPVAAMPLPERRGYQTGEVTTQELSASLGPDMTGFGDDRGDKLLDNYRAKIRAHLAGMKPPGGFGSDTVVVGFTLTRAGKVVSAQILESRGIYHLEQGTLNAVYAAAPFPKPPGGLKGARFDFAMAFRFE